MLFNLLIFGLRVWGLGPSPSLEGKAMLILLTIPCTTPTRLRHKHMPVTGWADHSLGVGVGGISGGLAIRNHPLGAQGKGSGC